MFHMLGGSEVGDMLLIYCFLFVLVVMGTTVEETYSDITDEDHPPQLDYKGRETITNLPLNCSYGSVIHFITNRVIFYYSEPESGI